METDQPRIKDGDMCMNDHRNSVQLRIPCGSGDLYTVRIGIVDMDF